MCAGNICVLFFFCFLTLSECSTEGEAAGLPVYQRSSVRWSAWWKSLQSRVSSRSAALRSSTCGGSTCCTLCGPAPANSRVFTYNVDFTYDLAKILKRAVFVLYISMRHPVNSTCWREGWASKLRSLFTLKYKSVSLSAADDKELTFF